MTRRDTRPRATSLSTATWVVLVALAAALGAVAIAIDDLSGVSAAEGFALFALPLAAMALVTGSVGFVIRLRRPANRVGALLSYGPILMLSGFVGFSGGALRMMTHGSADLLGGLAAAWGSAAVVPGIILTFPAVALVFPDGRLPGPRWRPVTIALVALVLTGSALTMVAPSPDAEFLPANPLALPGMPTDAGVLAIMLSTWALVIAVALAVTAVIVRFRRSRGTERQQLKWLVFSVTVAGLLLPLSFATDLGPAALVDVASVIAVAFVPITIGVGILRYRLYEIDRIISRTIGWAVVTGVLVTVLAGVVLGLQGLLAGVTQGETLAVAASTLVAAALFQPVRRRVQRAVDQRFDRARYDGERTAATFAERLRGDLGLDSAGRALADTVTAALRPSSVAVWLRDGPE